ncbi:MAG TPA: hypothetical protein P5114_12735 [Hyphomicrobiaceae bacterium]|nr:hypothetical protein [Hyphomicrobiaceae bacterium]
MPARSISVPFASREVAIPALIMIGAALNGLIVTMSASFTEGGGGLTFGISPFQIIALFVAARLSLAPDHADGSGTLWLEAFILALILVPSSAVSWLALAVYAAYQAWHANGPRRTGALIFLAVGLTSLWSSVLLKWLALPVTTAETFVIAQLLSLVRADIVQVANVVGNPDTHSLILMTKCTTSDALPHAAVALVAVAYLLGEVNGKRLKQALLALCGLYVLANLARLSAMAWSAESYALVHGPIGANVFDLFQAMVVLALGNWASEA